METNSFLQMCNQAMGFSGKEPDDDIDLMDLFGEPVEEENTDSGSSMALGDDGFSVTAGNEGTGSYSICSVEISPGAARDRDTQDVISSPALTEAEHDFVHWVASVTGCVPNGSSYNNIQAFVDAVYQELYPDRTCPGVDLVIYDYLRSRYCINITYSTFQQVKGLPIGLLKSTAHPYRQMAVEEVLKLQEYFNTPSFNAEDIFLCSLEPRDTELICELQREGKFSRQEAFSYSRDCDSLYFYLMLNKKGLYNALEYRQCFNVGSHCTYAIGKLNSDQKIIEALNARKDREECEQYLSKVDPAVIAKYKDAIYLAAILKYVSLYGVNDELIDMYFLTESKISERLISCLDNDKLMQYVNNNPGQFQRLLLEGPCKAAALDISGVEIPDALVRQLMDLYVEGNISVEDLLLYVIILGQENALSDAVHSSGITMRCREFIAKVITGIMGKSDFSFPDGSAPLLYQFRSGSSSMVFNVYEFINHFDYYKERIKKYAESSEVVDYNQIRGLGYCINFGRWREAFKKIQEGDKKYSCSLQMWITHTLGSVEKGRMTPMDIMRYNLHLLRESVPEDAAEYSTKVLHALSRIVHTKYVAYDLVLNYLYCHSEYCVILGQKNFSLIAYSLMNSILVDGEFNVTLYFLHSLFSSFYKCSMQTDVAMPDSFMDEPGITICIGRNPVAEFGSRLELLKNFDAVLSCISGVHAERLSLRSEGKNLVVVIM